MSSVSLRPAGPPAVLVCEDGRRWVGTGFGAAHSGTGEIVFATGMTGYQETLTDPSYHRQIIVQTAVHIGNTGMNGEDAESARIWAAGYVIRELSPRPANWRSTHSLDEALQQSGVPGVCGVDTRAITRHIRQAGAMRATIFVGTEAAIDPAEQVARVQAQPTMLGADLVNEVTTARPYTLGPARAAVADPGVPSVAVLDLGLKRSILSQLVERGCAVTVWPADTPAARILADAPDGILLTNGPGDPGAATATVATVAELLTAGIPVLGICFGHQLIARALGLPTYKLPFGHRGINQPVFDRVAGRVRITSQNHGFAVAAESGVDYPSPIGPVTVSHVSLNDGVVEGLRCRTAPVRSVQYHPEAAAGPHDEMGIFAEFIAMMRR
ncbi:MAG: glutamine-hydrolyzing carbamoyl-phosphate synthase small subunit [Actinomycetales bacterium]|nr:glutamine-hydrolyzing carbamoyl-phosphate synthase small subunit [Actinomycetales bacterium]